MFVIVLAGLLIFAAADALFSTFLIKVLKHIWKTRGYPRISERELETAIRDVLKDCFKLKS